VKERYYIEVDSETREGHIEAHIGSVIDRHKIKDFRFVENREVIYKIQEDTLVKLGVGEPTISLYMTSNEE
jgi:hypothetical protein